MDENLEAGGGVGKDDGGEMNEVIAAYKEMGLSPQQFKRYVKAALKLRELERAHGKNYSALVKDYEKKFRESVKLEYAISELLEKRRRIEEDLKIYLEQHKLTLETVNRVGALMKTLEKYSVDVNNLEQIARAAVKMTASGLDVKELFEKFARLDEVESKIVEANNMLKQTELKLSRVEEELNAKQERLKQLSLSLPEIEDLEQLFKRLRQSVAELEDRREVLSKQLEELAKEYEALVGFRGSAEDVLKAIEEKKEELRKLEEEVEKRREIVEVLEDEAASARSLMMLLQSPELVKREDLEALSKQFANIAKVKAGEIQVLKPLEQPLVENVRKKVVEFVMPAIKNDLIPKWVFEKLEKEFKEVVAKKSQLEEENERLRAELSRLSGVKQPAPEPAVPQSPVFFKLKNKGILLNDDSGTRVKLKCPYCQSTNLLVLPSKTELELAISDKEMLQTTCFSCSKMVMVDPAYIYERFYRV
ncbi:MAG: hypothetical protein QXS50_05825 [Candidatus Caldarchaeum sp.]